MPKSVGSGSAAESEGINGWKEVNFDGLFFFFISVHLPCNKHAAQKDASIKTLGVHLE